LPQRRSRRTGRSSQNTLPRERGAPCHPSPRTLGLCRLQRSPLRRRPRVVVLVHACGTERGDTIGGIRGHGAGHSHDELSTLGRRCDHGLRLRVVAQLFAARDSVDPSIAVTRMPTTVNPILIPIFPSTQISPHGRPRNLQDMLRRILRPTHSRDSHKIVNELKVFLAWLVHGTTFEGNKIPPLVA